MNKEKTKCSEEIIKYNKPNKKFQLLFSKEKSKLKKILPKFAKIEHVGSTAIQNLGGKNNIDIFIAVPGKSISNSKKTLQKNNYVYNSKWKKRVFFIKRYKDNIRFNVHLLPLGNTEFFNAVLLRDYLRNNKQAVKEYIKWKKEAIKVSKGNGGKYRNYKHLFMIKMIKDAKRQN